MQKFVSKTQKLKNVWNYVFFLLTRIVNWNVVIFYKTHFKDNVVMCPVYSQNICSNKKRDLYARGDFKVT